MDNYSCLASTWCKAHSLFIGVSFTEMLGDHVAFLHLFFASLSLSSLYLVRWILIRLTLCYHHLCLNKFLFTSSASFLPSPPYFSSLLSLFIIVIALITLCRRSENTSKNICQFLVCSNTFIAFPGKC